MLLWGELRLSRVLLESCASRGEGDVLYLSDGGPSHSLVVFTFVSLRPAECNGSLFYQEAGSATQLVLQGLSLTKSSACNTSTNFAAQHRLRHVIGCGGRYAGFNEQRTYGVCGSDAEEACTTRIIEHTSLESIYW